jgi:hypothetical protein
MKNWKDLDSAGRDRWMAEELAKPSTRREMARSHLRILVGRHLFPFFALTFEVAAPEIKYPEGKHFQVLAGELQKATAVKGARTVLTCPSLVGRSLLTMSVLPAFRAVRQVAPRQSLCIARTAMLAKEFEKRFRRLIATPHAALILHRERCRQSEDETIIDTSDGLDARPDGIAAFAGTFAAIAPRVLDDLIVVDPLSARDSLVEKNRVAFLGWLEGVMEGASGPDGPPHTVVLATQESGLAPLLVERGWSHIDFPTMTTKERNYVTAPGRTKLFPAYSRVMPASPTSWELDDAREMLSKVVVEALYT